MNSGCEYLCYHFTPFSVCIACGVVATDVAVSYCESLWILNAVTTCAKCPSSNYSPKNLWPALRGALQMPKLLRRLPKRKKLERVHVSATVVIYNLLPPWLFSFPNVSLPNCLPVLQYKRIPNCTVLYYQGNQVSWKGSKLCTMNVYSIIILQQS